MHSNVPDSPTAGSPAATPGAVAPSNRRVFASRLTSTLVLWAVLTVAFKWKQDWLLVAVTGFFGVFGAVEYFRLLRGDSHRSFPMLGLGICLAYWATVSWWVLSHRGQPPMWLDLAALTLAVQGAFLLCYRHNLEGTATLQRIFSTVFGVVYTVIFYGFVLRLMYFHEEGGKPGGVFLVLFLVMVTKFSDMGAYAFGVVFGRHKMIPHISPAKSWEGFLGAFVGAYSGAVLLLLLIPHHLAPVGWLHGMILAPLLCLTGISGDLAESVIKRCTHIKDSGHSLPGIGGVLDLTDSLLFTAPVLYFYLAVISL
jgi:phosphatidate cytidylyltransferase